ncbi:MAG: hydantoinase/oxoprolinase family protein [Pseudomonadota bacterium]
MSVEAQRNLLAVDIGGSFTDVVLEAGGRRFTAKALTTPHAPEDGVMAGISEILSLAAMKPDAVSLFILGTTLATNALIEGKGARTALIATEGFRDVLEMGHENRYAQYDLAQDKPPPLVPRYLRFGVPERVNVRGEVLVALDEQAVRDLVPALREQRIESVAVAFLHSYANPAHEQRVRELLQHEIPGLYVTLSSDVCPEVREYERTSTACANAYVQPVVAGYLGRLRERLAAIGLGCPFYLMTSGGAITTVELGAQQPIKLVESGPAGGAILARQVAQQCGERKVLSFDMGGTTAKICFIDDYQPELSRSFEVGRMYRFMKGSGIPVRIPVIEMVEIGAGGGSIARIDAMGRVQVGPESAVSDPGPACFGRGGMHPTVTDADCVAGLLDPARFASGKVRLQGELASAAIARDVAGPLDIDAAQGAMAIQEIVVENMANAARVHAVELGKTIEDYTMIAFGGAAPLHAAQLAGKLGISRVIIPAAASVGSALGFLWAPVAWQSLRSMHQRLDAFDGAAVARLMDQMEVEARDAVRRAAPEGANLHCKRTAYMRYVGQGHEIVVEVPDSVSDTQAVATLRERFEASYLALYGRVIPHLMVEAMSWSVTVSTVQPPLDSASMPEGAGRARPVTHRQVLEAGMPVDAGVYDRATLEPGARVEGPALVGEDQTTTAVPSGFELRVNSLGHLVMEKS